MGSRSIGNLESDPVIIESAHEAFRSEAIVNASEGIAFVVSTKSEGGAPRISREVRRGKSVDM